MTAVSPSKLAPTRLWQGYFHPAPHARVVRQHDTILIVDNTRGLRYALGDVDYRIWTLLSDGKAQHEIVEHLGEASDSPGDELATDVAALIEGLLQRRLIEPACSEPDHNDPASGAFAGCAQPRAQVG